MENIDFLSLEEWHPLAIFGFHDPFFALNTKTIINSWILIILLCIFTLFIRIILRNKNSVLRFVFLTFIQSFKDIIRQTLGTFSYKHFSFITALFLFITFANCMMIIPFLQEPTADLNTTLALGIIAFCYIQINAIKAHGIVEYLKEYFTPFFIMFPLHVVGKLATIISMSFRLFGNIFGGATIAHIYLNAIKGSIILETIGLLGGLNLAIMLFFGIFEGFLQAFVFTMLTLTYLAIALQHEETEHTKETR